MSSGLALRGHEVEPQADWVPFWRSDSGKGCPWVWPELRDKYYRSRRAEGFGASGDEGAIKRKEAWNLRQKTFSEERISRMRASSSLK